MQSERIIKNKQLINKNTRRKGGHFLLVGIAGFEPTTFRPPDERATRLRYIPNSIFLYVKKNKKASIFLSDFEKKQAIYVEYRHLIVFLIYASEYKINNFVKCAKKDLQIFKKICINNHLVPKGAR